MDMNHQDYTKAVEYFNSKDFLRLRRWPKEALKAMEYLQARKPCLAMQGSNEFTVMGTMKDFEAAAILD